jgi:hypothetical protein
MDGAGEDIASHAQPEGIAFGALVAEFGEGDVVGLAFLVAADAQPGENRETI